MNADSEISLLDFVIVLAKHKWLIFGIAFVTAVLAAIYSLTLPNIFTASTKILPPQQNQSAAAGLLAQVGGLAAIGGGALGLKSPNELYVGMLRSRRVADGIIQRLDLNTVFQQQLQSNTRAILGGMTTILVEKDGMISIAVDDQDPKRAAVLANAYVDELYKLTSVLAVTEASQRRLFFERQLALAKANLTKAEASAKQSLEKGGIIQVEGQSRAMLGAMANLRAQITVKEVQIGAMRTFAAEGNPELYHTQQELEVMKRELAKMEGSRRGKESEGAPASNAQAVDSLSLLRDVKYNETVTDLLARQFELAKVDEAKESALIQVLDKAIEPDRRSKPNRSQIVVIASLIGLIVGILLAFALEAIAGARRDPAQSERLRAIKRYLTLRRTAS